MITEKRNKEWNLSICFFLSSRTNKGREMPSYNIKRNKEVSEQGDKQGAHGIQLKQQDNRGKFQELFVHHSLFLSSHRHQYCLQEEEEEGAIITGLIEMEINLAPSWCWQGESDYRKSMKASRRKCGQSKHKVRCGRAWYPAEEKTVHASWTINRKQKGGGKTSKQKAAWPQPSLSHSINGFHWVRR